MGTFDTASLDTIAQLGTEPQNAHEKFTILSKRARAKTYTVPLSVKLASLESPLKKSYWISYNCCRDLTQEGSKITGRYCNYRWCSVCNRIRTAKLIIGYKQPLSELEDKRFVTLTLPNCKSSELSETLDFMQKTIDDIREMFKKRKARGQSLGLVGLRKLECTYNYKTNTYHPHFHFVIQGNDIAKEFYESWVSRVYNRYKAVKDGNGEFYTIEKIKYAHEAKKKGKSGHIIECDGEELELFKYFTKMVSKTEKGYQTFVEPLDIIFRAMENRRVFQSMGLKKDVSENIDDIISEEIDNIEERFTKWKWYKNDWVEMSTGEVLTGYIPSDSMNKLIDNIIIRPQNTDIDLITVLQNNKTMENQLTPFEGEKIRKTWLDEQWFFSVVDVIKILTDSSNANDYWYRLKKRENELSTTCRKLKIKSDDGKMYSTDCANTEGVFRILMSVPSPKAEPFKLWLASLGKQAIDEAENPELLTERQAELYKAKGYSDEWIKRRMQTIETRKELTDEWKQRGVKEHQEYAILTATIAKGTFGLTPSEHKDLKGLKRQNLRDHMTPLELIFTALSEELTRGKAVELDAQGFRENHEVAEISGKLTGEFVAKVESTGRKVISGANYLGAKNDENIELPNSE
jgi:DNA-damage-inducible protein D